MMLTTQRLILRDFEENDWKPTLEYQSHPEFLRFNPWTHRTEMDARSLVRMFTSWSRERPRKRYQLAIVLRDDNRLIGNCGLRMLHADAGMADLGYELDYHYWGYGYATEASLALLEFGFEQLHLHRIWAYCLSENTASARVLKKIGMRFEGTQMESEWMKGRWWSTQFFAMLASEWLEAQHVYK